MKTPQEVVDTLEIHRGICLQTSREVQEDLTEMQDCNVVFFQAVATGRQDPYIPVENMRKVVAKMQIAVNKMAESAAIRRNVSLTADVFTDADYNMGENDE